MDEFTQHRINKCKQKMLILKEQIAECSEKLQYQQDLMRELERTGK